MDPIERPQSKSNKHFTSYQRTVLVIISTAILMEFIADKMMNFLNWLI